MMAGETVREVGNGFNFVKKRENGIFFLRLLQMTDRFQRHKIMPVLQMSVENGDRCPQGVQAGKRCENEK